MKDIFEIKPAIIGAKPMDEWTVYRVTGQALDDLARAARAQF